MKEVDIFLTTSAKSPGKQKRAQYQYIMVYSGKTLNGRDYIKNITGHQILLICAIEALKRMNKPSIITIHTDSYYIANSHGNLATWKKNDWRRSDGKMIKNLDLWKELEELMRPHAIRFCVEPMYPYTKFDFS